VFRDLAREWNDEKAKMQAPGMKRNRRSRTKKTTDQGKVEKCFQELNFLGLGLKLVSQTNNKPLPSPIFRLP
jgi:hypothetical protein